MPNYNRNFSQGDYATLIEKYDELLLIREAAVTLTGEESTNRILLSLSKLSKPPHGKVIYLVQSESQVENNTVKVGFCKDLLSRWGNKWEMFANKKVFSSTYKGDAEVHLHLRQTFERDLENGRETYFGDFNEIADAVETFLYSIDK